MCVGALGILQCLPANPDLIGDQVPVDVVADSLIVAAATVAASHVVLAQQAAAAGTATAAVTAAAAAKGPAVAATRAAAKHVKPSCMLLPVELPPLQHVSPAAAAAAAGAGAAAADPSAAVVASVGPCSAAPAVAPAGCSTAVKTSNPSPEAAAAAAAAATAAAAAATGGRPGVYVIHSCSSDLNPTYWRDLLVHGREYNSLCPLFSRIRRHLTTPFFDMDFKQFKR